MQAHKVNSYAMRLYPTCGALFGVGYVLCMHVHHYDFLVGRFSTFLLAFICTKWEFCLYILYLKTGVAKCGHHIYLSTVFQRRPK
jgi:hypothetical protein